MELKSAAVAVVPNEVGPNVHWKIDVAKLFAKARQ
jgi:hypothetical protein